MGEDIGRYLLFAGSDYYPSGGWFDYKRSFNDKDEAIRYARSLETDDWWHVVDRIYREIVMEGQVVR